MTTHLTAQCSNEKWAADILILRCSLAWHLSDKGRATDLLVIGLMAGSYMIATLFVTMASPTAGTVTKFVTVTAMLVIVAGMAYLTLMVPFEMGRIR